MKQLFISIIFITFSITYSFAQQTESNEKVVIESKTYYNSNFKLNRFFSLEGQVTEIKSEVTLLTGINGGILINDHFIVGLGGYKITTPTINNLINNEDLKREVQINGGYGGLILGAKISPKEAVHLSFPVLIGYSRLKTEYRSYAYWNDLVNKTFREEKSTFLVLEPAAELEFNVTNRFKFGVRASYRFAEKTDLREISSNEFEHFNLGLSFKYGWF